MSPATLVPPSDPRAGQSVRDDESVVGHPTRDSGAAEAPPSSERRLAGLTLLTAGSVILMGIITAEALYPSFYTTADNEISDLGATRPPDSIILQPSATIFNLTMVAAGLLLIASAVFLQRAYHRRSLTIPAALLGVGVLGVGVFPGNVAGVHPLFALTAFVAGGVAAIASTRVSSGPLRIASALFGAATLVFLFGSSVFMGWLGDGGTERWVAYPVVIWMIGFGGYLLGTASVAAHSPSSATRRSSNRRSASSATSSSALA